MTSRATSSGQRIPIASPIGLPMTGRTLTKAPSRARWFIVAILPPASTIFGAEVHDVGRRGRSGLEPRDAGERRLTASLDEQVEHGERNVRGSGGERRRGPLARFPGRGGAGHLRGQG